MTNPNKTSITVILDKSGSMHTVRDDTIGGYNAFIEQQKTIPGDCDVTLIQFSFDSSITYKSVDVKKLEKGLLPEQYIPTGNTALLDAIGNAIIDKGAELSALPEDERPGKVMFVIITDGEENFSSKFNNDKIKEMVEHQKSVYSWDFSFLGANIDTFSVARNLGFDKDKSLSFSTTKLGGAMRAFASISNYVTKGRSADSVYAASYSEADRVSNA